MTYTALHWSLCLSTSLSLFNGQICCMCEAGDLCVLSICVFFSASFSSLACLCVWNMSSSVCQPFLIPFGDLWPMFPHHPCVASIPLSSSLYSPSIGSWIVCFSQEDTDEALTLNFYALCSSYFSGLTGFNLVLIFTQFFQHLRSFSSWLNFFIASFCLYLLPLLPLFPLADPSNRCGSLCDTNRPEAEGCLRPFSLITSHLCVHKQTNTAINLRAQCRLRGRGERIRDMEPDGERVLCHLLSSRKQVRPSAMFCHCYIIRGSLIMCPQNLNWFL